MSSIIERLSVPNEVLALICSHLADNRSQDDDDDMSRLERAHHQGQLGCGLQTTLAINRDYYAIASRFSVRSAAWDPAKDVFNFRLVCKQFAMVGAPFSHYNIPFWLVDEDLSMLQEIGNHPEYRHAVQSLTFNASTTTSRDKVSFEQSVERYYRSREGAWLPSDHLTYLRNQYEIYSALYDEQSQIQKCGRDYKVLSQVFADLPNIRSLEIQYLKEHTAMRPDASRPRHYLAQSSKEADPARDVRAVNITLKALSASPTVLESLQIWKLHHQFLAQQPGVLQMMFGHLRRLRRLELSIDLRGGVGGILRHDREGFEGLRSSVKNGGLTAMLRPLTELRTLKLVLPSFEERSGELPLALEDVFPSDYHLPFLNQISLTGLYCSEERLMGFLSQHRKTLRHLNLEKIPLQGSKWNDVFQAIRDHMTLETVDIPTPLVEITEIKDNMIEEYLVYSPNALPWKAMEDSMRIHKYCCGLVDYQEVLDPRDLVSSVEDFDPFDLF